MNVNKKIGIINIHVKKILTRGKSGDASKLRKKYSKENEQKAELMPKLETTR